MSAVAEEKPTLFIVRGLPGTGKTTLSRKIADVVFEADDYFMDDDGEYRFNPRELANAHSHCVDRAVMAMEGGVGSIAIANTFSRQWEAQPYIDAAKRMGYAIQVIETQIMFGNIHNVPEHTIQAMRDRWERFSIL